MLALVAGEARFQTLARAIEAAGLSSALRSGGPFTLLAPTEEAFDRLDRQERAGLFRPQSKARLASILKYHLLAGRWTVDELLRAEHVETVNGQRVHISRSDSGVRINDARLIDDPSPSGNGVVVALDALLLPSEDTLLQVIRKDERLSAFAELVKGTDLVKTLAGEGPMTLLAPTNEAIESAGGVDALKADPAHLAKVLQRHLIPDRRVYFDPGRGSDKVTVGRRSALSVSWSEGVARVEGVAVRVRNVDAANGVLHACDGLLGAN